MFVNPVNISNYLVRRVRVVQTQPNKSSSFLDRQNTRLEFANFMYCIFVYFGRFCIIKRVILRVWVSKYMQDTGGGGGLGSKYYLLILMQFVLQNIFLEKKHCIRLGFNYTYLSHCSTIIKVLNCLNINALKILLAFCYIILRRKGKHVKSEV